MHGHRLDAVYQWEQPSIHTVATLSGITEMSNILTDQADQLIALFTDLRKVIERNDEDRADVVVAALSEAERMIIDLRTNVRLYKPLDLRGLTPEDITQSVRLTSDGLSLIRISTGGRINSEVLTICGRTFTTSRIIRYLKTRAEEKRKAQQKTAKAAGVSRVMTHIAAKKPIPKDQTDLF